MGLDEIFIYGLLWRYEVLRMERNQKMKVQRDYKWGGRKNKSEVSEDRQEKYFKNKGVRTCGIHYKRVLRTLDCRTHPPPPPQMILTFIHSWGNWRITSCHNSSKELNPASRLRVALSLASNGTISSLCLHAYVVRKKSLKILDEDETTDPFYFQFSKFKSKAILFLNSLSL